MISTYFVLAYLGINLVAFALYGMDKRRARKDQWRIRESTLILISLLGPFGAIAGMRSFRHKTQKSLFKIVYAFAALHILLMVLLAIHPI